ncbi:MULTISPECIES: helix-turn-helix transcriptional regulator [unclassified Campylobacter]|uniref:helix-turn-helix domain-containing protein n=1 Tax=unclassified Campylobacter TaxID=2593542 RepID=UPI001EFB58EB|nr:helix-turn-helix transcriptional regulator [Campylobacter sp. RM12651]MBZ7976595.1 helix-turn-helix transcriptional regulator [Campylobacter sp. RM12637]ULO04102.1 type IIS restriction/modification system, control protein [Campylobacter sp. RM12651]
MQKLSYIFSKNLKKYRTTANLSQEELAFRSGLHRTYISAVERNLRNISINNIEKIANALNIKASQLLEE